MPGSETTDKVLGSAGLARLIGRIKAYVIPDGTTIERKQDGTLGLKPGGIQSEFLSNGCVTTDKIASSAVTSDKLADGSVETICQPRYQAPFRALFSCQKTTVRSAHETQRP